MSSLKAALILSAGLAGAAWGQETVWGVFEAGFKAQKTHEDPLAVRVRVTFTTPEQATETVEAFWDGGVHWRVRYMPPVAGAYSYKVESSDPGLNGKQGEFNAIRKQGGNELDRHGPPKIAADRRSFVHADNTPWFWLADTAWNGALLGTRDEWGTYLKTRASQRFTAVQFVVTQWRAGRADENGRLAFHLNGERLDVDPAFFRRMDERVAAIRGHGLVPVPVMLWALTSRDKESPGESLTVPQASSLARYIQARYHAYGPLWMLGGDGDYRGEKAERWLQIGRATFPKDLLRRPVTLHPRGGQEPWEAFKDEYWLDFLTYQSGHGDGARKWQWQAYRGPAQGWRLEPSRPVIDAEPNYEGHVSYQSKHNIDAAAVRRAAWYSLLVAPVAGITYGAHGVWPWIRQRGVPLDHPNSGEADPWKDCLKYPGAQNMTALRNILDRLPWWTLRPDPMLASTNEVDEGFSNYIVAAKTDDGQTALAYLPNNASAIFDLSSFDKPVRAAWIDPRTGQRRAPFDLQNKEGVKVETPGPGDWLIQFDKR